MGASSVDAIPRPARTAPVALSRLADGTGTTFGTDVQVTGITASSDRVRPGDLFAGLPGRTAHGASFAADAISRGALAVLTDAAGRASLAADVPVVVVPDVRTALGPVSAQIYGRPSQSMRMLGVTGTSGKTTTTFLMRAGLLAAGRVPGLIGTVATMIGDETLEAGFTTPEAPDLQALLAVMVDHGVTDVAMEVSSHALTMGRVGGVRFDVGAFTNLSEDHLDFHIDMEDYFAAKVTLFDSLAARGVVVVDDEWGRRVVTKFPESVTVSTDGSPAGWRAVEIADRPDGTTSFRALGPSVDHVMGCAIPGRYNVANALLALAVLVEDGVPAEVAAPAIAGASVPGRMERIDAGQPFLAVVDYSHKPAAVEGALRALRLLTRGRLAIVLGCGGDRDTGKRPHMGEIAARGADLLIVTDDNPRSEDPASIRSAMRAGAESVRPTERGEVQEVGDRRAAIETAVRQARPGDTVLIAGKGHETGQEIAGVVHPFDDRAVLREALGAR